MKTKILKNFLSPTYKLPRINRVAENRGFDAIPHLVWYGPTVGTLDFANTSWSDYTGLSYEKSKGRGWQKAIYEKDLDPFLKTWKMSQETGSSFEAEIRILGECGEVRWFWVKVVCKVDPSGALGAWLGTCTDIHDRKIAEMNLIQAKKEANAASVSRASFLANMSHEIRTPMNAILGFTELMLDPVQSIDERYECIETVQRNASKLLKTLDEILEISKVESDQIRVENREVDLMTVIENLNCAVKKQAQKAGLEFKFKLLTPAPQLFKSDSTRICQILLNLAGNAIKFTKAGYVHVTLEWKALTCSRGQLIFRILDSGVGVQAASRDLLFKPFIQEDSSITRSFGGAGLGLAHSRQIARALGGDVILESSIPGQGSVFCFSLEIETPEKISFLSQLDFLFSQQIKKIPWSDFGNPEKVCSASAGI